MISHRNTMNMNPKGDGKCNLRVKQQSGAVLIVSLIILLVLTVVVMTANRGVVMQERMTAAVRETNLVFQAAESALIEAEAAVESYTVANLADFVADGTGGKYSEGDGPADFSDATVWDSGKTIAAEVINEGYSASYFIESMGQVELVNEVKDISLQNDYSLPEASPMADVFKVVVRAVGPNGTTEQIIAGYYSTTLEP